MGVRSRRFSFNHCPCDSSGQANGHDPAATAARIPAAGVAATTARIPAPGVTSAGFAATRVAASAAAEFIELKYYGLSRSALGKCRQGTEHDAHAQSAENRHDATCLGAENERHMALAFSGLRQQQYHHHGT